MKILFENYICPQKTGNDFSVDHFGCQECDPSHSYGPFIRNYYLMHFVFSGKGVFYSGGKSYAVNANEGFMIYPGDSNTYTADADDPWLYYWIGFDGAQVSALIKRCGISRSSPVFSCPDPDAVKDTFRSLIAGAKAPGFNEYAAAGYAYILFSRLLKKETPVRDTLHRLFVSASEYIYAHFSEQITVAQIAESLFVDRSYLYRIFMKECGRSPAAFISDCRIKKAAGLLAYSGYGITDIAVHCGYADVSSFCKAFKKEYGVSAREYRNKKAALTIK